ncbi:embryonic polyadenylate-binding protein 2 isoform X1 [Marmota monax]|uniref:embryonic polyadenylate-binding protein 2 isoform X1 n=1 Tax=Marmota monax TaxID=9995 RepID=UPI0026E9BDE2|nr:embryonic polyadenylate-binding protein 2 isoform X1 [Marmota monax]
MWPFLSHALFPPPTEAWLQAASSDPEAQGWGACSRPEKTPLESGGGGGQGERRGEAEEDDRDASFLLSLLEPGSRAESPGPDQVDCGQGLQELEAIKLKLWALEQVKQRPEPPSIQGRTRAEDGTGTGRLLSSPGTTGCPFPGTPKEKVEADHRSIYVGNVSGGRAARAHPSRRRRPQGRQVVTLVSSVAGTHQMEGWREGAYLASRKDGVGPSVPWGQHGPAVPRDDSPVPPSGIFG